MELNEVTSSENGLVMLQAAIDKGKVDENKLDEFLLIKTVCYDARVADDPILREWNAVLDAIDCGGSFKSLERLAAKRKGMGLLYSMVQNKLNSQV
ncbi:MAG: hypothetical protein WCM93_16060 [Bacteroidota bacterium]